MFRKMILTLAAVIALTAWASAKPGTWGKEQAQGKNAAEVPAVKFNRWLNEFSAAYKQRDGEKMDELLKRFEGARAEFPNAPRIEKWMGNVKEAYDGQDVQKMGRLLDNAHQMRQRTQERFRQNQPGRMERNQERMGAQDRPMRRPEGDFRGRQFGPQRDMDARPLRQNRGQNFDRPGRMGPDAQLRGNDRAFEDRTPRFNARRPMDSDVRPEGFAGGRYREQMGRNEMAPGMQNRFERPQFDNDMPADRMNSARRPFNADRSDFNGRRDSDRQDFGPRMQRQQNRNFNENTGGDFWD